MLNDRLEIASRLMAAIELLPPIFLRSLACSYKVDAAMDRARALGLGEGGGK